MSQALGILGLLNIILACVFDLFFHRVDQANFCAVLACAWFLAALVEKLEVK